MRRAAIIIIMIIIIRASRNETKCMIKDIISSI